MLKSIYFFTFLLISFFLDFYIYSHPIMQFPLYFPNKEYKKKHLLIPTLKTNQIAIYNNKSLPKSKYLDWLYNKADTPNTWKNFVIDKLIQQKLKQLSISNYEKEEKIFINTSITNELKEFARIFHYGPEKLKMIQHKRELFFSKIFKIALILEKLKKVPENLIQKKFRLLYGKYNKKYNLDIIFYPIKIKYLRRGESNYYKEIQKSRMRAIQLLNTARKKLINGESRYIIALQYSDDENSKYNGGFIGLYKKGKFNPIVDKLGINEVSEIIKNGDTYSIYKIEKNKKGKKIVCKIQQIVNIFKVVDLDNWENEKNKALKKINIIKKKLNSGTSFSKLLKFSKDYKPVYGENPQWDFIFGENLRHLQKGDISDIIITQQGVQIVKIKDIKYTKFTDKIRKNLVPQVARELARSKYNEIIENFLSNSSIKRWHY